MPPFVNHKGKDVNSDWFADQWNERSVLGHAQFHKGGIKGNDPEIDTAQTPKRCDWCLAPLKKTLKTFTDSIPLMNLTLLEKGKHTVFKQVLKPGSHLVIWVVRIVQKDPKDKDSESESFVFWVFPHSLNNPSDLNVNQALLSLSMNQHSNHQLHRLKKVFEVSFKA